MVACSTPRPSGKTEAEVLFKEANELINDSRYLLATEKLNQIRSKYPYSYYATHAELLQADILFKQENYTEAAAAYILFKDFHPKHKKLNHVIWSIAESYYKQLPETYDRDLSPGFEAIKYYEEVMRVFPGSDFAKKAQDKIKFINEQFRLKEQYIADFYFKTEVYDAARYRYLDIINNFKDDSLRNHSMLRILESSYNLKEKDSCQKYYTQFKSYIANDKQEEFQDVYQKCAKL